VDRVTRSSIRSGVSRNVISSWDSASLNDCEAIRALSVAAWGRSGLPRSAAATSAAELRTPSSASARKCRRAAAAACGLPVRGSRWAHCRAAPLRVGASVLLRAAVSRSSSPMSSPAKAAIHPPPSRAGSRRCRPRLRPPAPALCGQREPLGRSVLGDGQRPVGGDGRDSEVGAELERRAVRQPEYPADGQDRELLGRTGWPPDGGERNPDSVPGSQVRNLRADRVDDARAVLVRNCLGERRSAPVDSLPALPVGWVHR